MESLLEVQHLSVSFETHAGELCAVRDVSFCINKGEAIAIVGESGCGKSAIAQAITRLLPEPQGKIASGEVWLDGENLVPKTQSEMRKVRGKKIGMIFQDPMSSLNPTMRVGRQIAEGIIKHQKASYHEAKKAALDLLKLVGIPLPEQRIDQYPHEFSGGMRQRVMIAIALACHPMLLIADEPTTALDVTIQAQILVLLKDIQKARETSILLITHDLGVVAGTCDRVIILYAGKVVESGTVDQIFYAPQHPYTQALLNAVPILGKKRHSPLSPICGYPPNPLSLPSGCAFAPRCPYAMEVCKQNDPKLEEKSHGHLAACWKKSQ